jgi:hypothetical protein
MRGQAPSSTASSGCHPGPSGPTTAYASAGAPGETTPRRSRAGRASATPTTRCSCGASSVAGGAATRGRAWPSLRGQCRPSRPVARTSKGPDVPAPRASPAADERPAPHLPSGAEAPLDSGIEHVELIDRRRRRRGLNSTRRTPAVSGGSKSMLDNKDYGKLMRETAVAKRNRAALSRRCYVNRRSH